jgi:hypothetical protein
VGDGVLNDQRLDALRMGQRHAKADRTAVILQVERVTREPERFGEAIHDRGEMVERVGECLRVRPVAVAESRIIGRDQMIAVSEPAKERLEHARRRGKSVQKEKRRRFFGAGLPVEDG